MSDRARRWVGVLVIAGAAGAGVFGATRIELTGEITHFLPDAEDRQRATLSSILSDSELSRTWVVTVGAPDRDSAAAAGRVVAERLRDRPEIARLRSGAEPALRDEVYDQYFPRRMYFADPSGLDEAGLADAARRLRRELGLPTSTLVRRIAPEDPLLLFLDRIEALDEARTAGLELHEGQLVSDDGFAVIVLTTSHGAFDNERSRPLAAAIESAVAAAERELGLPLVLEQSSVHRLSIASEASIRADIQRISIASTIGILLLFMALFRSLRVVLLTFLPVAVGVGFALAVVALTFGRIHGLTLAFGASLIGVCVDYSVHLTTHHAIANSNADPPQDRGESLRRVWPGILLGGLTTVAGLAGLAWTSFPGIREIAVFATIGVLGALVATRLVVAPWLPAAPKRVALQQKLATAVAALYERVGRRPWIVLVSGAVLIAVSAVGLPRLEWVDSLAALNQLDPDLEAEDERVRRRVSRVDAGRFVVSLGEDEGEALDRNDAVAHRVRAAEEAGELAGFRSLHAFVWGPRRQAASLHALRRPELPDQLERVFTEIGFAPETFGPFFESLADPPPPLTLGEVADGPFGDAVGPFVLDDVAGRVAVLTFVRGVDDPALLEERLADVPDAFFFDQHAFLSEAYGTYRARTLELVGAGLIAVLLLVLARYRRPAPALAAFLPALVAAASTLGLLGLLGLEANLMHLMALLLVLSIGVDYGVFVVEHRDGGRDLSASLSSIVVACLTTLSSFGLLAMSANPALRSLGITVGVGVFLALVLAPGSLALSTRRR